MESINEPIRVALWILASIHSYINLPTNDQLLKRLFETCFSYGIDLASIEKIRRKYWGEWIKNYDDPLNWIFSIFKKHKSQWISIFPELENIFCPENIKPISFYALKNADDWKDSSEDFIKISVFSISNDNKFLWCLIKDVWKDCSGSQAKALLKKQIKFPAIACFLKNDYQSKNYTREIQNEFSTTQASIIETEKELKSVNGNILSNPNNIENCIDIENNFMKHELQFLKEKIAILERDLSKIEKNNTLLAEKCDKFENHLLWLLPELLIQKKINDKFKNSADPTILNVNSSCQYTDKNNFILNGIGNIKNNFEDIDQNLNQTTNEFILNYELNEKESSLLDNSTSLIFEIENLLDNQKILSNKIGLLEQFISESFKDLTKEFTDKIEFCMRRINFTSSKQIKSFDKKIRSIEKSISVSLNLPLALKENHYLAFNNSYNTLKVINPKKNNRFISSMRSLLHIFSVIPNFEDSICKIQSHLFSALYESLAMLRNDFNEEYINELKLYIDEINPMLSLNNKYNCRNLLDIIASELHELTGRNIFSITKSQWMICKNYHQISLPEIIDFSIEVSNSINAQNYLESLRETIWFTGDNKLHCEICGKLTESKIVTKEIKSNEIISLYSDSDKIVFPENINIYGINYELLGKIILKDDNYISCAKNEDGILVDYNQNAVNANQSNQVLEYMNFYRKLI